MPHSRLADTDVDDVVITYTDRPASLGGTVALPKTAGDAGRQRLSFSGESHEMA
jgi:hypothetical protein